MSGIKAQPFTSAVLSDNGAGVNVSASNTGNDILSVGSDVYRVSVWTDPAGSHPGMSWVVDAAYHWANKQDFNQTSNILHTDVCLVKDGSDVWAIVAWYYSGSGASWNIEAYKWTTSGTNGTFSYQGNDYVNGSYGTTLNIDGDDNGNFVAVYDDNNQDIYALTGTVTGGFAMNSAVQLSLSGGIGIYPDVGLYFNNNGPVEMAYVCYIEASGASIIYIDEYDFSQLSGGTGSNNPIVNNSAQNNMYFSDCRIACPDQNGSQGEWTVVVLESDHSSYWNIVGYNSNNNTTAIYYNDGTYVSPNGSIKGLPNSGPVVTYESNHPNDPSVYVGWMVSDLGNANAYVPNANFPVVMPCDLDGIPTAGTYWIVPYTLATNDAVSCLSLSVRYANDKVFATYWNVNSNGNVYTKEVTASSASSMKVLADHPAQVYSPENVADMYPAIEEVAVINVYNLNGQLVLNGSKSVYVPEQAIFNERLSHLPPNLYLVHFLSAEGNVISSFRLSVNR